MRKCQRHTGKASKARINYLILFSTNFMICNRRKSFNQVIVSLTTYSLTDVKDVINFSLVQKYINYLQVK